jgi:FkbH-like protein
MEAVCVMTNESSRIAILANSTVELLKSPLQRELAGRGLQTEFWFSGYGQYRQAVLDRHSGLYEFAPSEILLLLDAEDLFPDLLNNPFQADDRRHEALSATEAEIRMLVRSLLESFPQSTLLLNTITIPPLNGLFGLEYNSTYQLQAIAHRYNAFLGELAKSSTSVVIVDVHSLVTFLGFNRWYDPRLWYLAQSRWSNDALKLLAHRYSVTIQTLRLPQKKCVVVDLDNTLWGGILGEEGAEGILLGNSSIGLAYSDFQNELLNLYRKGILLAICSKNDEVDALQVIRSHPGMRLREHHFAAHRINWEDKASNLRSLATELNIGLDSLIFIDDNPVERAWVRSSLPYVLTPEWPEDPARSKSALLELAAEHLYRVRLTKEDLSRGEEYQTERARRTLAGHASSLEDFYRSLQMRATITLAAQSTIPRIAQLTKKTNQFNLTTRRYSEADIQGFSDSPDHLVFCLNLEDQFGDNGLVGVIILHRTCPDSWTIDTFLLSCRVMGRTAEQAFLGHVCAVMRCRGAGKLVGEYRRTLKNSVAADIYRNLGFSSLSTSEEGSWWEFDLEKQSLEIPEWFQIPEKESAYGG